MRNRGGFAALIAAIGVIAGCERDNMWTQARAPRLGESAFFADGRAAREPVPGSVAHGSYSNDTLLQNGTESGKAALRFPFAIDDKVLERGKDRYGIYCGQCHGEVGDGVAIVVQRGYRQPKPFSDVETMKKTLGELYQTFMKGAPRKSNPQPDMIAGTGYDLEDVVHPVLGRRLPISDRWAVIAWIKVLQASQHFSYSDLTSQEQQNLAQPAMPRSQNGSR